MECPFIDYLGVVDDQLEILAARTSLQAEVCFIAEMHEAFALPSKYAEIIVRQQM